MFETEIKKLIEKPMWVVFMVSWVFYLAGLVMFSHFVWSEDIYSSGQNNAGKDFENYIDFIRRIDNVRYLLSPFFIALYAFCTWLLIQIGIKGANQTIQGRNLFKIVLLGLLILSLPLWIKSVYFVLIVGEYAPDQVKYFYPLSVLYFFNPEEFSMKVVKALGRLNLFQFAYMLFISWCVKFFVSLPIKRIFFIVLLTYGFAFILLQLIIILIFI
jgi:hypothetical protein